MGRIAGRFAWVEPRQRSGWLVHGLLSDLPRKNCWTIAELAGEANPHGRAHRELPGCRLPLPWNSGVVEGHVNRIKILKRQMFGRAGFALLRKRVLLAP